MIARSGAAMLPARKSESLLLLVTLCAGAGWIFSKEALGALPPVFFIAVRFLAGGLLLGLAVPAADRREWRRSLWPAFAIGSLICGSMMCWIVALHLT
ncbi:EamA family transporter, partial [Klebsiella michiganensis]